MNSKIPFYDRREITDLKEMLNTSASLYSENPAFWIKEEKGGKYLPVKYKQLKEDVDALGTALMNMGLSNHKIAVIGENRYEWVVTYLAVVNGLGIIVPLDKELPKEEQFNLLKMAEVDAIVYSDSYKHLFEGADIPFKINMDGASCNNGLCLKELVQKGKAFIHQGNHDYINAPVDPDALNIILFTSGTTDMAKGVMLCHRNICSVILSTCSMVRIEQTDRTLSILPIHHTFECSLGILLVLYRGASIAFCEGLKYIGQNIVEAQATVIIGVPLIFESIYHKIWKQAKKTGKDGTLKKAIRFNGVLKKIGINLSPVLFKEIHKKFGGKLRLLVSGAAAIDPEVVEGFEDFGIKVVQGYGLTECAPLVTGTPDCARKSDTIGVAIDKVEVDIFEPDSNGIGEIRCKGPNVMLGYYKDEASTSKVMIDGWFHTGDLGYKDKNDYFYITGRKKNVIVTKNGKNVYPEEVEFYLNKSQYVEESLVCGILNEQGDTLVTAQLRPALDVIYEEFGEDFGESDLYELLKKTVREFNDRMPIYKRIRNFNIRNEEFIKTTTKKIKRHINAPIHAASKPFKK